MHDPSIQHHIKAIAPALAVMEKLGFSASECLKNTGISEQNLHDPEQGITLEQELQFHENLLQLSTEPLLGLKLGEGYRLESYGVLGYAMLSASTMLETLELARSFDLLTFTHFKFDLELGPQQAQLILRKQKHFDPKLLQLYEDRELAAVITGAAQILSEDLRPTKLQIMHPDYGLKDDYESYFDCSVEFNHPETRFFFDSAILNMPTPLRDPETSTYCREQCQRLLNKLSQQQAFSETVRHQLIRKPGYFPSIEALSEQLNLSVRTIRRRLTSECTNYQQLLNEIRYELAKDYLQSALTLEQISALLGYSDASNFSHAFKRWHGSAPKEFRFVG